MNVRVPSAASWYLIQHHLNHQFYQVAAAHKCTLLPDQQHSTASCAPLIPKPRVIDGSQSASSCHNTCWHHLAGFGVAHTHGSCASASASEKHIVGRRTTISMLCSCPASKWHGTILRTREKCTADKAAQVASRGIASLQDPGGGGVQVSRQQKGSVCMRAHVSMHAVPHIDVVCSSPEGNAKS